MFQYCDVYAWVIVCIILIILIIIISSPKTETEEQEKKIKNKLDVLEKRKIIAKLLDKLNKIQLLDDDDPLIQKALKGAATTLGPKVQKGTVVEYDDEEEQEKLSPYWTFVEQLKTQDDNFDEELYRAIYMKASGELNIESDKSDRTLRDEDGHLIKAAPFQMPQIKRTTVESIDSETLFANEGDHILRSIPRPPDRSFVETAYWNAIEGRPRKMLGEESNSLWLPNAPNWPQNKMVKEDYY